MENNCIAIIKSTYPSLSEGEKKIADYVLGNQEQIISMTISDIALFLKIADSSVIRFCKKIGFEGFTEFKINLARNLDTKGILPNDIYYKDSYFDITAKVFRQAQKSLEDSLMLLDKTQLENAVDAILAAKRVEFYGIGTSAPIAMDAYYRFMRIGINTAYADDPHIARVSAKMLDKDCAAIGISHTGRTKDTIRALEIAKETGATTICITGYINSPITKKSDISLIISPAEINYLKEAITARTAQITLIDSIYSCVVIKKQGAINNIKEMNELLEEIRY